MFPDPKAMLKRLHEKGLEVCVWINPYVAQRSRLFQEGKENGYFIKNSDVPRSFPGKLRYRQRMRAKFFASKNRRQRK